MLPRIAEPGVPADSCWRRAQMVPPDPDRRILSTVEYKQRGRRLARLPQGRRGRAQRVEEQRDLLRVPPAQGHRADLARHRRRGRRPVRQPRRPAVPLAREDPDQGPEGQEARDRLRPPHAGDDEQHAHRRAGRRLHAAEARLRRRPAQVHAAAPRHGGRQERPRPVPQVPQRDRLRRRPHPHQRHRAFKKGRTGFWQINTASHADFPQQSREIEVMDNRDGTLSLFTTSSTTPPRSPRPPRARPRGSPTRSSAASAACWPGTTRSASRHQGAPQRTATRSSSCWTRAPCSSRVHVMLHTLVDPRWLTRCHQGWSEMYKPFAASRRRPPCWCPPPPRRRGRRRPPLSSADEANPTAQAFDGSVLTGWLKPDRLALQGPRRARADHRRRPVREGLGRRAGQGRQRDRPDRPQAQAARSGPGDLRRRRRHAQRHPHDLRQHPLGRPAGALGRAGRHRGRRLGAGTTRRAGARRSRSAAPASRASTRRRRSPRPRPRSARSQPRPTMRGRRRRRRPRGR